MDDELCGHTCELTAKHHGYTQLNAYGGKFSTVLKNTFTSHLLTDENSVVALEVLHVQAEIRFSLSQKVHAPLSSGRELQKIYKANYLKARFLCSPPFFPWSRSDPSPLGTASLAKVLRILMPPP